MQCNRNNNQGAVIAAPRFNAAPILFWALLTAFASFLLLPAPLAAESSTTVELELYDAVSRMGGGTWTHAGGGQASLKLDQTGNRSVRSSFELAMLLVPGSAGSPDALADVSRAYAKFRHGKLVGIIGKAPFSWGEGTIFNAAQAIFGAGLTTQLAQTEFEDNAAWLTGITLYTGPFSFLELLVLPPAIDMSSGSPSPAGFWETRAGARWTAKPLGIKTELGYLLDGRDAVAGSGAFAAAGWYHRPYLSLQGNLWLDWHLSASLEIPENDLSAAALRNGTLLTAGLYSLIPVGYDDTLNFRLESRIRPWGQWEEDHSGGADPDYAIYGYGELAWDFGDGFSLIARSLFSPADLSARLTPGFSWNIFQGLTLFGFATVQAGERQDVYAWAPDESTASGLSFLAGCSVVY
jgi:hypothetical protein